MAEIWFYHLENKPVKSILPTLLQKGLERGWRMAVEAGDAEALPALSDALWAFEDVSFLPHGQGEDAATSQPIWLCADAENLNAAAYRFFISGAFPQSLEGLSRAIILFESESEDMLLKAREEWKKRKSEGHVISYWKQDENGAWKNMA